MSRAPEDSEGIACDWQQASCGVPANQPLSFEFDRWLLPSTATRQSMRLSVVGASSALSLSPEYELLTRTVRFRASGGLEPGLVYLLSLNDADSHEFGWGFQSYDLRPLERRGLIEPLAFRTGPFDQELEEHLEEQSQSRRVCRDALASFRNAGCTRCHANSESRPTAGLALDGAAGLADATGRVAYATDKGGQTDRVSVLPERFGLNMALVQSSEPAFSFILYRMLLRRDTYRDASGRFEVSPPADTELQHAEKWFSAPGPMPPLGEDYPSGISPVEQVRVIEKWIRDGADNTECD